MTDREAIDRVLRTRGACPICEEQGATYLAPFHALRGHLSKEHTVDHLVYQIAGEAVLAALDEKKLPKLATGGLVKNPGGVVGSDSGCVIYFDPRVERIITAEQIRNSPSFQAALEKFRQSVTEIQERESQDGDSPNT